MILSFPFPESVDIAGDCFLVSWDDGMDDNGGMDFDRRKITIHASMATDRERAWKILRHEMHHAALCMSGVAFADRYEDEVVVRATENLFFPAWNKVKRLFEYAE